MRRTIDIDHQLYREAQEAGAKSGSTVEEVFEHASALAWVRQPQRPKSGLNSPRSPRLSGLDGLNEGFDWASLAAAVAEADMLGPA